MTDEISREEFQKLVQTSALDLRPDEAESLRKALNRQMQIIRQLDSIPLEGDLQPMVHGNPYPAEIRPGLREDTWLPYENAAGILDQIPSVQENMIVSPDVPHQRIG